MNGINIVLIFLALFGFLPMAIVLYKKKRVNRIMTIGRTAQARVYHIFTDSRRSTDTVNYYFLASDGKQYTGSLTISSGTYQVNSIIEVFYMPENPKRNTVKGAWQSNAIIVFVVLIALGVLFMTYKLYEMVNSNQF